MEIEDTMTTTVSPRDMTKTQLVNALSALYDNDPDGWARFLSGMNKEHLRHLYAQRLNYLAKKAKKNAS